MRFEFEGEIRGNTIIMRLHFPFCSAAQFTTVKLYLIAFLFTRFKEKREKKDSFQERERFFTESVLSFSLFARSMREREGKDIDM